MKLAILNNSSNLYECNIPLNILICKSKLSELKLIANAHQIKHSSRVKKIKLQNLILTIFEFNNKSQIQKKTDLKNIKIDMLKNINLII